MKAIIFPGQGAQYAGMGKSLYDNYPKAKDVFCSIDEILEFKLSDKCFNSQEDELKDTAIQQLAILSVSLAAFSIFNKRNTELGYLAGLSLGEYSCLHAGGVLSLEDTVTLVKERGIAMQEAARVNPSVMFAVIGSSREKLEKIAQEEGFYIANLNAPNQIVISLAQDNKEGIKKELENNNLRVIELGVSGGFHSPFMNSARKRLADVARGMNFKDSTIPIVSNFTAQSHTKSGEIKENLLAQLVSPVLWEKCVELMIQHNVDLFFEVGPSKILKGLIRKIAPSVKVVNLEKQGDFELLPGY